MVELEVKPRLGDEHVASRRIFLCLVVKQKISFITQSFFTDEEINILKKFKLYVEDNWNKCDMVAILLFVVGVSCR